MEFTLMLGINNYDSDEYRILSSLIKEYKEFIKS